MAAPGAGDAGTAAARGVVGHVILATVSFAISFAAWGLIAAAATDLRARFALSAGETGLLIAAPVLLGALARIPIGALADRYGARRVLAILMIACAEPIAALPYATSFGALLGAAVGVGFAGASFAAGASYVTGWVPAERRGTALGLFGIGNAGQALAVFAGPLAAQAIGWRNVFVVTAAILAGWGIVFWLIGRDGPRRPPARRIGEIMAVWRDAPLAWVLAGFYFVTFGGFVALGVYLPTLLVDQFHFSAADAGWRAAGFVVAATAVRPIGGWLADRVGGARVLAGALLGLVPFALLLAWPSLVPFTVGALGCAALLGAGNGAVFQQVARHFPAHTGAVTGLVGALGALGGFFPPLLLGFARGALGVVWPGFVLLAACAFALYVIARRVLIPRDLTAPGARITIEKVGAGAWATQITGLLVAAIFVGSRNLQNFDPALVIYTFAVVFATWGIAYHYRIWITKPPAAMYHRRGWQALRRGGPRSALRAARLAGGHLLAQRFIRRRSLRRWWAHQLIFWGCILAAAITFPLVFGWIHFTSAPGDPTRYVTYLFGFPAFTMRLGTPIAWAAFHGLDIAAFLVLGGIAIALVRRLQDRGALALQSFARDLVPLFLLIAVSVTGLLLTVSSMFMRGTGYGFLAYVHAMTVIATLLYLPFGKLFHVFQRPAQIGVKLYLADANRGEPARCVRCKQPFASKAQVDDLAQVLRELGFDYRLERGDHWQAVCPTCKRQTLAVSQLARFARAAASRSSHGETAEIG